MSRLDDTARGFQTRAIHDDDRDDAPDVPRGEPVSESIHLATTFRWREIEDGPRFTAAVEPPTFYRRIGSPNVDALERRLARLEHAERALAVGSGMAANTVALMTALERGGHVVSARTVYGESATFLRAVAPRMGARATFVDDVDVDAFARAMEPDTRAVFIECPANPTLDVVDLVAVGELARRRGAVTIVDATLATPYNCQPLRLGCDVVTHSATKYLSGHSDAMGGLLAAREDFIASAWNLVRVMGAVLSPFDAWLIDRGLRTLGLRMERHNANGERVAAFLDEHPAVARVAYPTAKDHPARSWARTQHRGFGGVIGLELRGGAPAAERFVRRLRLFTLATSLGGVESLVQYPASMARLTEEDRARLGIPVGMVRLAVGCEDADDLVDDLRQALDAG